MPKINSHAHILHLPFPISISIPVNAPNNITLARNKEKKRLATSQPKTRPDPLQLLSPPSLPSPSMHSISQANCPAKPKNNACATTFNPQTPTFLILRLCNP